MRTTPVYLSMGLLASGCVFQPPTPQQIAAAPFDTVTEPAVICKKEKPTGSNRKVMVCREVQGAHEQEQTRRTMRRLKRQSEGVPRN